MAVGMVRLKLLVIGKREIPWYFWKVKSLEIYCNFKNKAWLFCENFIKLARKLNKKVFKHIKKVLLTIVQHTLKTLIQNQSI